MHMTKLPQITLAFWIMKIAATTLGETAGDLFSMTLHLGYAVTSVVLLAAFLVVLIAQLRAQHFHPFLYWGVILATSTAGTTMSDFMDRTMGLGYARGAAILLTLLLTVLAVWRWNTGSLSVTTVTSRKAEAFYWAAILVSNTLGTALGDFLADNSGLGFKGGALLISGLLALVVLAHYVTRISGVVLFWIAFVLTRPFGATLGDVLTKTPDKGGVGFGTVGSSLVLLSVLVGLVVWTRKHHLDVAPDPVVQSKDATGLV
ncbi:MAG: membrane protein [Gemmatimonadaceae bacterium]